MTPRCLDLPNGYQALIDEADWPMVQGLTLYRGTNGYVYFSMGSLETHKTQTLHSLLLGPHKGRHIDHINGDKLDNRRENLRVATHSQNQVNRKSLNKNNRSGARGVSFAPNRSPLKPWRVQITVDGKNIHLGQFGSKEDAISARRLAEQEHYGELCP